MGHRQVGSSGQEWDKQAGLEAGLWGISRARLGPRSELWSTPACHCLWKQHLSQGFVDHSLSLTPPHNPGPWPYLPTLVPDAALVLPAARFCLPSTAHPAHRVPKLVSMETLSTCPFHPAFAVVCAGWTGPGWVKSIPSNHTG